ncbi:MAG: hypothetical protein LBD96_02410, partial [Treponema sp.]|nr:hypothetical protein [Treponema sp.]
RAGYEQLADYLRSRGRKEGYLLTFDFRKESNREAGEGWVTVKPPPLPPASPAPEPMLGPASGELRIFDVML